MRSNRIAVIIAVLLFGAAIACGWNYVYEAVQESYQKACDEFLRNPLFQGPATTASEHYKVNCSGYSTLVVSEDTKINSGCPPNEIDITVHKYAGKSASVASLNCAWKANANTLLLGRFGELGACDPAYSSWMLVECVVPANIKVEKDDGLVPHGSRQYDPHPYESYSRNRLSGWTKLGIVEQK